MQMQSGLRDRAQLGYGDERSQASQVHALLSSDLHKQSEELCTGRQNVLRLIVCASVHQQMRINWRTIGGSGYAQQTCSSEAPEATGQRQVAYQVSAAHRIAL